MSICCHSNRHWILILLSATILLVAGCGGEETKSELDPLGLLTDYKQAVPRHHPYDLVEIDLGHYDVSIPVAESVDMYHIGFSAAAIVPRERKDDLDGKIQEFNSRIQDMVLQSAQRMSPDNISDPYQAWLKSEILAEIAHLLKTREVRDVVFSEYSFERR